MIGLGLSLSFANRPAGSDTPTPPEGFVFLIDSNGAYLVDEAGAYLITEAT